MQHNDDDLRPKVGVGVMVLKNGKVLIGSAKERMARENGHGQGVIWNIWNRLRTVPDAKSWKKQESRYTTFVSYA
jgi:hypothetical protein